MEATPDLRPCRVVPLVGSGASHHISEVAGKCSHGGPINSTSGSEEVSSANSACRWRRIHTTSTFVKGLESESVGCSRASPEGGASPASVVSPGLPLNCHSKRLGDTGPSPPQLKASQQTVEETGEGSKRGLKMTAGLTEGAEKSRPARRRNAAAEPSLESQYCQATPKTPANRVVVMPLIHSTSILLRLPTVKEEDCLPSPPASWYGEYSGMPKRCSSVSSSDRESFTSSNSFSECDLDSLEDNEEDVDVNNGGADDVIDDEQTEDIISLPDPELLSDPEGEQLCPSLLKLIKRSLARANISSLRCSRLLLPDDLIHNLGQELLHLAYSEPCGLRGAIIDLCVEQGKACYSAAQITVDPAVVPTFQLTVLLRPDSRLWPRIQGLFSTKPVPGSGQSLKLSPGFKVLKKKFYSSEEFIIEEC
uniref:DNA damage-inducible transcript 4 protein n=1 Tax=Leptobrachium leishanense TaxID=445787 RepID=A0A8C5Q6I9_9ANUR